MVFNSLLLIDTVGNNHLHLAMRFIIINSADTLRQILSKGDLQLKNSLSDNENLFENSRKVERVKAVVVTLIQIYETLVTLLKTLLASHVDNFRDSFIIDSTINLFLIISDYLGNVYSEKTDKYISNIIVNNTIEKQSSNIQSNPTINQVNNTVKQQKPEGDSIEEKYCNSINEGKTKLLFKLYS